MIDTKPSPTVVHFSTWVAGLTMELILFGASLAIYTSRHREPKAGDGKGLVRTGISSWEAFDILIMILRFFSLAALVTLYASFGLQQWSKTQAEHRAENGSSSETEGLLNGTVATNGSADGQGYGSTQGDRTKAAETKAADPGWARKDKIPTKGWWEYVRGYGLFLPYLWPSKSPNLQFAVCCCIALVAAQRVVNVLVPYQIGKIINILSHEDATFQKLPWGQICLFILYRFMQGNSGLLNAARASLWIPVGQYSFRELSTASFEHVHSLSLDFHLGKKTGEVISALSKGNSINNFLEQLTFSMAPMVVDLFVAFWYFLVFFDAYYALVVAIVTCTYMYVTVRLAQWRVNVRRNMTNADRQLDAVKYDSRKVPYET